MIGDQDLQTLLWVMRPQLAHIPGAKFIVLPDAAHSINREQPEAFNRNVLEFNQVCDKIGCGLGENARTRDQRAATRTEDMTDGLPNTNRS